MKDVRIVLGTKTMYIAAQKLFDLIGGIKMFTEGAVMDRKILLDSLQDHMSSERGTGWESPTPPPPATKQAHCSDGPRLDLYKQVSDALHMAQRAHDRIDTNNDLLATLTSRVFELEKSLNELAPRFNRFMELISAEIKNPIRPLSKKFRANGSKYKKAKRK